MATLAPFDVLVMLLRARSCGALASRRRIARRDDGRVRGPVDGVGQGPAAPPHAARSLHRRTRTGS
jgi:hypothetical protein